MIDFDKTYPSLSAFNANSPTYTRKSKTGKTVVVRKGKRKKQLLGAALVGGVAIAGVLAGRKIHNLTKANKLLTKQRNAHFDDFVKLEDNYINTKLKLENDIFALKLENLESQLK